MQDWKLVEKAVELLLESLHLKGQGFEGTPERVARMWKEFLDIELPNPTICKTNEEVDLVMFRNHTFWSFCPHHLLPVKYNLTVGYIPNKGMVLGASKPLRISNWITASLPLQEDIPGMICKEIEHTLNPAGTGCIVQGEHLCMRMRGVKSLCSDMITPLLKEGMRKEPWMSLFLFGTNYKGG